MAKHHVMSLHDLAELFSHWESRLVIYPVISTRKSTDAIEQALLQFLVFGQSASSNPS